VSKRRAFFLALALSLAVTLVALSSIPFSKPTSEQVGVSTKYWNSSSYVFKTIASGSRTLGYVIVVNKNVFGVGNLTLEILNLSRGTWVNAKLSGAASVILGICRVRGEHSRKGLEIFVTLALSTYPLRSLLLTEKILLRVVIHGKSVSVTKVRTWVDFGDGCPSSISILVG